MECQVVLLLCEKSCWTWEEWEPVLRAQLAFCEHVTPLEGFCLCVCCSCQMKRQLSYRRNWYIQLKTPRVWLKTFQSLLVVLVLLSSHLKTAFGVIKFHLRQRLKTDGNPSIKEFIGIRNIFLLGLICECQARLRELEVHWVEFSLIMRTQNCPESPATRQMTSSSTSKIQYVYFCCIILDRNYPDTLHLTYRTCNSSSLVRYLRQSCCKQERS